MMIARYSALDLREPVKHLVAELYCPHQIGAKYQGLHMPFHSQLLVPLAAKVVLGFGLSVLSSFSILLSPLPSHGASPTQNDEDHRQIWSLLTFEIQHALQEIGLYHGPLDGFANPDLLASVLKYQESQGLPQDGIVTQELLDHLRIDGRSNKLLSDLAEQKKRNQDTARESLLAQEETKDLLALKPTEDISDAARDKDRCLTMPTVTCLIDEALESAKAVNKAEYRRWVYREVMKGTDLCRDGFRISPNHSSTGGSAPDVGCAPGTGANPGTGWKNSRRT